jgi:hypothetical protein
MYRDDRPDVVLRVLRVVKETDVDYLAIATWAAKVCVV